ncbi:hypothetical protein E2C01_005297 [Portunus trituberculatus]|uniref:Uncharacterized protein n=1 Tax=Portunus trituberculatus TaxID=210409 RepID=A0A5B7CV61_PORTR|nr:hypothetical protein [Portunus trituberculatus]
MSLSMCVYQVSSVPSLPRCLPAVTSPSPILRVTPREVIEAKIVVLGCGGGDGGTNNEDSSVVGRWGVMGSGEYEGC